LNECSTGSVLLTGEHWCTGRKTCLCATFTWTVWDQIRAFAMRSCQMATSAVSWKLFNWFKS